MVSVNISLRPEAYELLKRQKAKGESFSDVIVSRFKRKHHLLDFFGVLKEKDWDDSEKKMASFRDAFNRRLKQ